MKKAVVSVINDLVTDQRVDRTCRALHKAGYEVLLVGRIKKDSPEINERPYQTKRFRLWWDKGPLFYAAYNLRLFFFLLFNHFDLYFSNDLDTLLPNFLVSRLKKKPILYDSHELFTETPEVIHRKFVKRTWELIEKSILPRLDIMITVNNSIAGIFHDRYGIGVKVVRNIPDRSKTEHSRKKSRQDLGLPVDKKILILQGAGINIQRGAEELVEAMRYTNENILLLIIGGGDVFEILKGMIIQYHLEEKVIIKGKLPYAELIQYTMNADLGLTLDKDTNLNYRFSLPNKIFDYIHAGIPVLASPLPELKAIIDKYGVGKTILTHEPRHISEKIEEMLGDPKNTEIWKLNLQRAALALNWENEEKVLMDILEKYK